MTEIIRTRIGVLTYLAPTGPLTDGDGAKTLGKIVESCLETREINLVLDLDRVPTITGIIIDSLLDIQDRLAKMGGYIKVVNANAMIKDTFLIIGYSDFITETDNI